MEQKLRFKSVVSLVIGSQIGSGIFLLPTSLAPFGTLSLMAWLISGAGALLLALVFSQLSMHTPKGGGPHVYIEKTFGRKPAFFAAWTYWIISWASSIAVIVAAVGYLSPLIGISSPALALILELGIITLITALNIKSASLAGSCEVLLTVLKCLPLVIIPVAGFFTLSGSHFTIPDSMPFIPSLNSATLLTFWGFIGIECATTAASIIENPTKTIPRAVLVGTLVVAAIYFLNSFAVMGIIPPEQLATSQAPYADAASKLFGGGWHKAMALVAFISCIGTLNAWVLTSGQIAMGAAKEGLFPAIFGRTLRSGAPYFSLIIALVLTQFLLFFTLTPNLLEQLNNIIDLSVSIFVVIYLACSLSFMAQLIKKQITPQRPKLYLAITAAACGFCLWILAFTSLKNLLFCLGFIASGIPVYLWQARKPKTESLS